MSNVKVIDKRGGKYQAVIEFTYGECERLPFNILRRINAKIEAIPDGGIKGVADFDIRIPRDSSAFIEMQISLIAVSTDASASFFGL